MLCHTALDVHQLLGTTLPETCTRALDRIVMRYPGHRANPLTLQKGSTQ
jgi:hypothetical protein